MTRIELRAAIKSGDPTPGVAQDLFESCYEELMRELYPGSSIVTLLESRSTGALPEGIHARVAAMLTASHARRDQVRRLSESHTRSDLKDIVDPVVRAVAEAYKQANTPDAITARAANRDRPSAPFRLYPKNVTLQESRRDADRIPEGLHAFLASRL